MPPCTLFLTVLTGADKGIRRFFSSIQRQQEVVAHDDETKSSEQLHDLLSACTSHTLSVRQHSSSKEYYVAGKIEIFLQGKKRKLCPPPRPASYTRAYTCCDANTQDSPTSVDPHPRVHNIVVVGTCIRAKHETREKFNSRTLATNRALVWLKARLNPKKRSRNNKSKPEIPYKSRPTRNSQPAEIQLPRVDGRRNNSGTTCNKGNTKPRKRGRGNTGKKPKLTRESQQKLNAKRVNRVRKRTHTRSPSLLQTLLVVSTH